MAVLMIMGVVPPRRRKINMAKIITVYVLFLLTEVALLQSSYAAYNVIKFGAKPDGKTDSTPAFHRAWSAACNSGVSATIHVPRGSFMMRPIIFKGPCKNKVLFSIDGTIVAPSNYWALGSSGFWILFYKVSRVTVSGGTIDAKGAGLWACKQAGKHCPPGARSIAFMASSNIVVSRLRSINSQLFHIAIDQSHNVMLQNVKIRAPSWSPNTDGVHMQSSTGISVRNSTIRTGDDCISIGPGSKNVSIQRIACGPGHGISVGSLAEYTKEDGVQNVTVKGAVFTRTTNGVRIKSWARKSTGFATDIVFQNIVMKYTHNPIIIDQKYCPTGKACSYQNSGVAISGVTYKNIKGTSATEVAVNFVCSGSHPCRGLKLEDINLTYYNRSTTAKSFCSNAIGSSSGVVIPPSCLYI